MRAVLTAATVMSLITASGTPSVRWVPIIGKLLGYHSLYGMPVLTIPILPQCWSCRGPVTPRMARHRPMRESQSLGVPVGIQPAPSRRAGRASSCTSASVAEPRLTWQRSIHRPCDRYPTSWLNPIERYISALQRKAFTQNDYASLDRLAVRLRSCDRHYEAIAKPLERKFPDDDLQRLLKRVELPSSCTTSSPLTHSTLAKL